MNPTYSDDDLAFRRAFESCECDAGSFDHRSHVRLAYIYLCDSGVSNACDRVRKSLLRYLNHHEIDPTKYHETITRGWVQAVNHFMRQGPGHQSFASFIESNPQLLDSEIMLSHYSKGRLFSDKARLQFVPPDLSPIPTND